MRDLVASLFSQNGYRVLIGEGFDFFIPEDKDSQTYWLVVETDPKQVISSQHLWLERCQELYRHESIQKNTNLICLWQVAEISPSVISQVHEAEEDLFFFKKHVIYYTPIELNNLHEMLGEGNFSETIHSALNSSTVFSDYKKLLGTGAWQELVFRLVIKLGFIDIGDGEPADIQELYSKHKSKIQQTKQPELLAFIESAVLDLDFESTSDPELVLDELASRIVGAGYEIKY